MYVHRMTEDDGRWCLQRLEKSYYSKDNVKTYDETVRKSVSSKTFSLFDFEPVLNSIKSVLPKSSPITFKPYKFNCCSENCFFAAHKDTLSNDGLVGTLIIFPCSSFKGGDLVFPVQERTLNISQKASDSLQFVFFDIQYSHEVSVVTSGYRYSIVFGVYALNEYVDSEQSLLPVHLEGVKDETVKSFAVKIHEMLKNENNILYYDVFDPRLASELTALFGADNSIKVYFGKEDPGIVFDDYNFDYTKDDFSDEDVDEWDTLSTFEEECVEEARSYDVEHIIGKSSKLITEHLLKSFGGNSPCEYVQKIRFFKGILFNPANPTEPALESDDD